MRARRDESPRALALLDARPVRLDCLDDRHGSPAGHAALVLLRADAAGRVRRFFEDAPYGRIDALMARRIAGRREQGWRTGWHALAGPGWILRERRPRCARVEQMRRRVAEGEPAADAWARASVHHVSGLAGGLPDGVSGVASGAASGASSSCASRL